jgi:predicted outer membrane protein
MGNTMMVAVIGAGLLALAPACKKESVNQHRTVSPVAMPETPPMRQTPTGEPALPSGSSQGGEAVAATAAADQYAADVVGTLHQDNLNEIELGKLAQEQGQATAIKQYGAMLVSEHSEADQRLTAYAGARSIPLNRGEAAQAKAQEGRGVVAKLRTVEGAAFDRMFARLMVDDHQKAVQLVTTARSKVGDAELRALLAELQPMLEKHLQHASTLVTDTASAEPPANAPRTQGRRPASPGGRP